MWSGPPAGIVRVELSLARWGLEHRDDLTLAFFDSRVGVFRELARDMAQFLINQDAVIDRLSFVNPERQGKRKTDRIPRALQPFALWFLQSRRMALRALERKRLTTKSLGTAASIDAIQRAIMSERHRALMIKPDGSRRPYLPVDSVIRKPIAFDATDTLVCAGSGWTHHDVAAVVAEKRRSGCRLVLFCHDIIPLMFPQFYRTHDVAALETWCRLGFPSADLLLFASRTVEKDVRAYCKTEGITIGASAIVPLGADFTAARNAGALPADLEPGRYALLVSTIEPRKGHRLIYEAWLDLLAAGVPQRTRFKLVFVGRPGWLVDDLLLALRNDRRLAGNLIMLADTSDATLSALYHNAAFCLYPSQYEGFGLPVIESFRHGKAVLASNGGALREVVGDFSPCLDPNDAAEWRRMLRRFIEDPAARTPYETRIREAFRHPTWDEAAAQFFAHVTGRTGRAGRPDGSAPPG